MRSAALWYARHGYAAFPCSARTKRPAYARGAHHFWAPDPKGDAGLKRATGDENEIMRYWPAGRDIAPGLAPPEGVIFLDLDEKSRAGIVETVLSTWPELEAAPLHLTPSGGAHIPLRQRADAPLGQSVAPELGIDVRTHRGYVLAPPAPGYKVVRPLVSPAELPEIPVTLVEYLRPEPPTPAPAHPYMRRNGVNANAYAAVALRGEIDRVRFAARGGRNNQLNRAAFALGQLVAAKMLDQTEVEDALREASEACGLLKEEPHRTLGTIASGLSAGKLHPRQPLERQ
jgi:hypothetical protein